MTIEDYTYAGVPDRFKAFFIDSVVYVILSVMVTALFSFFDTVSDEIRGIAFVTIFFLYDPILIAFSGSTIGQKIIGIRVKQEKNSNKNINLILAIIRFTFKIAFGWVSLLTISRTQKGQAIHDMLVGSIVLINTNRINAI